MRDPETNIHHLAHLACCALFIMWNDKNTEKTETSNNCSDYEDNSITTQEENENEENENPLYQYKKAVREMILIVLKEKNIHWEKSYLPLILYYLIHKLGDKIPFTFDSSVNNPIYFGDLGEMESTGQLKTCLEDIPSDEILDFSLFNKSDSAFDYPSLLNEIRNAINDLRDLLEGDVSFERLEITIFLIYSYTALKNMNLNPTDDDVFSEFVKWKGNRYSLDKIKEIYRAIEPELECTKFKIRKE